MRGSLCGALLVAGLAAAAAPVHATSYNYTFPDGAVGFALSSQGGVVNPGVLVGFNPQPDPPAFGLTTINLSDPAAPVLVSPGPCRDGVCVLTYGLVMAFQGIGNAPLTVPAPPNADGFTTLSFSTGTAAVGHVFDVTLHVTGPTSIVSWVAFNPQPDPPADWFAVQATFASGGDPDFSFSMTEDGQPLAFAAAATPLPAALPLFASGAGLLGIFGWRKRRKAASKLAILAITAAAFSIFQLPAARAAPITYDFDYILPAGGPNVSYGSIVGMLTTDGALGALTGTDVLSWDLFISAKGTMMEFTDADTHVGLLYGLTASASALTFDFSQNSAFTIGDDGCGCNRMSFYGSPDGGEVQAATDDYEATEFLFPPTNVSTVIATVGRDHLTTPLPAALPLLSTGLGGLVLLLRRRKTKAAPSTA